MVFAGLGFPAVACDPAMVKNVFSLVNGAHLRDLFKAGKLEDGDGANRLHFKKVSLLRALVSGGVF